MVNPPQSPTDLASTRKADLPARGTMRRLPLQVNFVWTLAGNVVYAACQWGILVVLAKIGSAEMVGQFSLGLAITAPVIMFTNLQLRGIQATDAREEYHFGHYFGLRLSTNVLAMLVILGIVLASGYHRQTTLVILAIGLAKTFEAVSDVIYGLIQRHERMDRIAISLMIKGPLSLLALGTLVWMTRNVFAGALGLAAAWLTLLLTYDLGNARRLANIRLHLDVSTLWRLVRLAFPLGIVMMLISLNTNVPRYFVTHYWNEKELGYFAAMAYLMTAGNMVISALGQSASPRLAQHYANRDRRAFRQLLFKLVGIGVALGVAGVALAALWGRQVLTLLYRPEYANRVEVFVWLMVAAGVGYVASMLGYGATARRNLKWQPAALLPTILTGAAVCRLLVPSLGILGAAFGTVASSVVSAIGFGILNVQRKAHTQ